MTGARGKDGRARERDDLPGASLFTRVQAAKTVNDRCGGAAQRRGLRRMTTEGGERAGRGTGFQVLSPAPTKPPSHRSFGVVGGAAVPVGVPTRPGSRMAGRPGRAARDPPCRPPAHGRPGLVPVRSRHWSPLLLPGSETTRTRREHAVGRSESRPRRTVGDQNGLPEELKSPDVARRLRRQRGVRRR